MLITKQPDARWQVESYPNGRTGKRIRKVFTTKGEAISFERYVLEQTEDKRLLSELVEIWFRAHGITLADGGSRKQMMLFGCQAMGEPLATEFNAKLFSVYREKRLSGKITRVDRIKSVAPRTTNLELAYFRAMFNELHRLGEWKDDNPLKNVRSFRTDGSEMAFLSQQQIESLLKSCRQSMAKDLELIVKIALSTGARWSEAESLTGRQITPYKITFTKTKGKRNRTVPISKALYDEIPKKCGALFTPCYSAFRMAMKRTGIELPHRQSSHVLRHTFASHFMMNGGNILVLQRILGHTDIKMTMRYSHFSPEHLEDAVKFNPLSKNHE
ncbi:tyrosine-type recombinase/integrase [Proteus vulgaris]|uniref:phage integrase n=1 Tax=Proteus TaxID=583 RepID=UPI000D693E3A|nr:MULTISPECIES: tyrosine-type recombinase/integrase [Proteus]MBQ0215478.1 tyrosine-type recombinase/integrase [Proteus vulgaris]